MDPKLKATICALDGDDTPSRKSSSAQQDGHNPRVTGNANVEAKVQLKAATSHPKNLSDEEEEVDIIGDVSANERMLLANVADPDATESFSSFDGTDSDNEVDSASSDDNSKAPEFQASKDALQAR